MKIKKAVEDLKELIGREKIYTEQHYLSEYSFDSTGIFCLPDAVIFPTSEEDIVKVAQIASRYKIPVVPRGSGTSRSGGPLPLKGGFLLSFTKMNRIIEIDPASMVAVVEPGVITQELNNEAAKFGLYYPPDPSSVKVSTIGGNISHNAGGIHAVKYGVTKNYILGMHAVTIDGRILRLGGKVLKSVVGYDLARLISGSEGTLAIISQATLRLIPRPDRRALFVLPFLDEYGWIEMVLSLFSEGILPCSIEFMDSTCVCVNKRLSSYKSFMKNGPSALLFIELDGSSASLSFDSERLGRIISQYGIDDFLYSSTDSEIDALWDIRRDVSPSLDAVGKFRIADDISIPLSELKAAVSEIKRFAIERGLKMAIFGHAGDSNLHTNFIFDSKEEMERDFATVMNRITEIALRHGGSISGEHGVGILKKGYSERELDSDAVSIMREIKRLMDPDNLLNPGKIFKD